MDFPVDQEVAELIEDQEEKTIKIVRKSYVSLRLGQLAQSSVFKSF